jgi:hypothetical protein
LKVRKTLLTGLSLKKGQDSHEWSPLTRSLKLLLKHGRQEQEGKMATKEFNLALAKTRAKVLSEGSDLTEVTRNLVNRNINQFQRNTRNGTPDRPSGGKPTIAQQREESRNVILKAWVGSMPESCARDMDDPNAYSPLGHQLNYRAFFLRTIAGKELLRFIAEGDGRMLGRLLMNICLTAHQVRVQLASKSVIESPVQVYMDFRKDMWERVKKTGDFMSLIQRQERLLQRVATTIAFTLSDKFMPHLTGEDRDYTLMFRALFTSHLQQLPLGTVGEIQQTAFMLEAIFAHCDIGALSHKIGRGREVRDMTIECNPLMPLVKGIASIKRTSGNFNPDA